MKNMRNIARGQQGFTLIELVMVIVILGILAAVAVPKFSDLSGSAASAAADGILGGANSACTTVFAEHRVNDATTGFADTFDDILDVAPAGWAGFTTSSMTMTQGSTTYTLTLTAEEAGQPCTVALSTS